MEMDVPLLTSWEQCKLAHLDLAQKLAVIQVLESSSGEQAFLPGLLHKSEFYHGIWVILHKRPSFISFYHMVKTYIHIFSVTSRHCEAAGINE